MISSCVEPGPSPISHHARNYMGDMLTDCRPEAVASLSSGGSPTKKTLLANDGLPFNADKLIVLTQVANTICRQDESENLICNLST